MVLQARRNGIYTVKKKQKKEKGKEKIVLQLSYESKTEQKVSFGTNNIIHLWRYSKDLQSSVRLGKKKKNPIHNNFFKLRQYQIINLQS